MAFSLPFLSQVYWSAYKCQVIVEQEFEKLLFDPSRSVRTTAANLLSRHGDESHISKLENLVIRDPITDRWITPLISRLRDEKGVEKKSNSLKNDLLDIRDQLDRLIKSQKD